MKPIELPEAVAELRRQISRAESERPEGGLRFEIQDVELHIQGTMSRSTEADAVGKVKFSVLGWGAEVGANAGFAQTAGATHTVKIKLKVTSVGGETVEIANEVDGNF